MGNTKADTTFFNSDDVRHRNSMSCCGECKLPGQTESEVTSSQSDSRTQGMRFQRSVPEHEPRADSLCKYRQACQVKDRGRSEFGSTWQILPTQLHSLYSQKTEKGNLLIEKT